MWNGSQKVVKFKNDAWWIYGNGWIRNNNGWNALESLSLNKKMVNWHIFECLRCDWHLNNCATWHLLVVSDVSMCLSNVYVCEASCEAICSKMG